MGSRTIDLAREAVLAAARLRAEQGLSPSVGICPFDLSQELGVSARLVNYPSLEGMYSPSPRPAILVNAERPAGRRRYSCGHELGHHVFKHGFRLDELDDSNSSSSSPEEFLAQRFSAALLMPTLAVNSAFARRGWSPATAQPEHFFVIAQELGVGYTTLLFHQELNLQQLTKSRATGLRDISIPQIRSTVAGFSPQHDVFYVDDHWLRESVDVEVGDVLIVPQGSLLDGDCATLASSPKPHAIAVEPGTCFITLPSNKKILLRVSRRNFIGLARHRFIAEVEDDV
ncbi:MAG: ImmA/IrrE family metallo-endopeptidase [Bdellovibrionota bacterium]